MYFEINRIEQSSDCIRGVLTWMGVMVGIYTLEPPHVQNKRDVSCINNGLYVAKRHLSPTKGPVFHLQNVVDREWIYIGHTGSTIKDTLGCILLGLDIGTMWQDKAVLQSESACIKFMHLCNGADEIYINIS